MDYRIISAIDRIIFNNELNKILVWATLKAKELHMDQALSRDAILAKLTKAINSEYPKLSYEAGIFLASTAMLSARIGG